MSLTSKGALLYATYKDSQPVSDLMTMGQGDTVSPRDFFRRESAMVQVNFSPI